MSFDKDRKDVKVFHESELDEVLSNLSLFDQFQEGTLNCPFCHDPISIETIGCIFLDTDKNPAVCCSKPICFESVGRRTEND